MDHLWFRALSPFDKPDSLASVRRLWIGFHLKYLLSYHCSPFVHSYESCSGRRHITLHLVVNQMYPHLPDCHLCHVSSTASAEQLASHFLEVHGSQVQRRSQRLDANQLKLLYFTLNRAKEAHSVAEGTPLPPGFHIIYFTPHFPTKDLASDGAPATAGPGGPFVRRMWAGGEMRWQQGNRLCIGDNVIESVSVESCQAKRSRNGEAVLLVRTRKTYENERGLALTERLEVMYMKNTTPPDHSAETKDETDARPDVRHVGLERGVQNVTEQEG